MKRPTGVSFNFSPLASLKDLHVEKGTPNEFCSYTEPASIVQRFATLDAWRPDPLSFIGRAANEGLR